MTHRTHETRDRPRPDSPPSARAAAIGCALALALASVAATAQADNFWQDRILGDPAEASVRAVEYESQMVLGDSLAEQAGLLRMPRTSPVRRRGSMDYRNRARLAVEAYEKASEARPDAAEPHYRAAEMLYHYFLDDARGSPVLRNRALAERTLRHWDEFGRLAPLDPRVRDTLFRAAIIHTKLAGEKDLERAAQSYEVLLERTDLSRLLPVTAASWLGNLAETYMMLGRLDDAIITYRRALGYDNRAYHAYGLAVALDRDEQGYKAREVMRDYGATDRLRELESDGIFFVPQGERHYYLALGNEALGNLEAAIAHYQLYIDSGAHPRYQPRAIANLRAVERRRARTRSRPTEVDIDILRPGIKL